MELTTILSDLGSEFEKRAPELDKENNFAEKNFLELKERGVYKALIPKELGGHGVTYTELCNFLKDLAKFCPSTALTLSMHQHLIAVLTFKFLNGDAPSKKILQVVAETDLILVSTGGGDWLSSNGSATKVEGGYKINCVKAFCSGSPIGNVAVMSCAYDDGAKEHILHFSVPLSSEGVEILNDWDAMGMRGTGSNSIKFKDVFVPDEKVNLIRDRGVWHPLWNVVSTLAFPIFMAPYAGVAEAIAEKTIKILSNRPNKDSACHSPIGRMQNHLQIVKWAIDDMIQRVNDFEIKPSEKSATKAHQAKTLIAQHGRECAQSAMEAMGGYSYFKKVGIERLYRDLLAGEFHPMQTHKQEAALGEFMMTGKL